MFYCVGPLEMYANVTSNGARFEWSLKIRVHLESLSWRQYQRREFDVKMTSFREPPRTKKSLRYQGRSDPYMSNNSRVIMRETMKQ